MPCCQVSLILVEWRQLQMTYIHSTYQEKEAMVVDGTSRLTEVINLFLAPFT